MAGKDVMAERPITEHADRASPTAQAVSTSDRDASETPSPLREYQTRLERHYGAIARYAKIERAVYRTKRVMIFSVIGYVVFDPTTMFFLTPLFISLVPLVIVQMWAIRGWGRTGKRIEFYDRAVARIENRWMNEGDTGTRYGDDDHPYALDLDIFGRGSLFQLLCTARTPAGCDALADWLKSPAETTTIVSRQRAVRELLDRLDFREAWAVLEADASRIDASRLQRDPSAVLGRGTAKTVSVVLAVVLAASLLGTFINPRIGWPILCLVLIVELGASYLLREKLRAFGRSARDTGVGLQAYERFARLVRKQSLDAEVVTPVARFGTGGDRLELRAKTHLYRWAPQEPFFVWLWLQVWPDMEQAHADLRRRAVELFTALGELEALGALACYAFEHPADPFPEIVADGPHIEAADLGHPLIAERDCVRNDVRLDGSRQMILVSGSNMSGKSTLLRSLGTNAVLALVGAPVRARRLALSPMSIGTAMRFRDSVHDGTSYFFAVVRRLKTVTDLLEGQRPLLFLIDEMLQGTNSHDRRVGAEAVVRMLIDGGAVGLITTHDLTLTELTDTLGPRAANMHFEDQVTDGRMTFDYKIKPGVVQKSNALELMRIAGLKV